MSKSPKILIDRTTHLSTHKSQPRIALTRGSNKATVDGKMPQGKHQPKTDINAQTAISMVKNSFDLLPVIDTAKEISCGLKEGKCAIRITSLL